MQKNLFRCAGLLFLLVSGPVLANFSLEARSDIERWSSGIGNQATGVWGGLAAGYRYQRFLASAGLSSSLDDYRVRDEPDASMTRRDIDFSLAYQVRPSFSVFMGYRTFRIEYANSSDTSRSFADNIQGIGGGLGYGRALWFKVSAFMSVNASMMRSRLTYTENESRVTGSGLSWGSELGIVYRFSHKLRGIASTKFQSMSIDYSGESWNNNYTRAGLRLSYHF